MSIQGTDHKLDGIPCQDWSDAVRLENGWVIAAVADGVGSAVFAQEGSKKAVETVISFIKENIYLDEWNFELNKSLLMVAFGKSLQEIINLAKEKKCNLGDYDTTLDVVIYNGVEVVFGHSGDGGIISLSNYGKYSLLTEPQKGEAFNELIPLRAGPTFWVFGQSRNSVCSLLLLTDGIYDTVCPPYFNSKEYSASPIHIKKVRRFMDIDSLGVKTIEDCEIVEKQIKDYFHGSKTKDITDDKTIIGIINLDISPEPFDYPEPDWEKIHKDFVIDDHEETLCDFKQTAIDEAIKAIQEKEDIFSQKENKTQAKNDIRVDIAI